MFAAAVYVKALFRRAQAFEKLDKLTSALDDFNAVCELDASNRDARRKAAALAPRAKAQQEKEKEEMLGKLKDLGNSFLGKFGMSLDNFNAVQDPKTGSYSINFNQGGGSGGAQQ